MRARQRRTLERLFQRPTPANIRWRDVVSLMDALNFEITERSGSRVAFDADDEVLVLHKPHPRPEMRRAAVRDVVDFLERQGVTP